MYSDMFCSAIIVAGGSGKRMGKPIAKQYLELCGEPIIKRTVDVFLNSGAIDEVILVVPEGDVDKCREIFDTADKIKITAGGKERYNSVYNGVTAVNDSCNIILIHDGVRPFVTESIINSSIGNAVKYGASIAAVKSKDTVKICDENGFVVSTPLRENVYSVQTPQTFKREIIEKSFEKAFESRVFGTDDATLAENAGYRVFITEGSYENIKITTPEDLIIGEKILESRMEA